jgi:LacI family transcriptional regulator
MNDVAALAGVALKTVSRVVNGVQTVDPELARRVRTAADKLGYRPNLAASNLRRGRSQTIGLLLADVSNQFSAELHRAVEDRASEEDILVLAVSQDEDVDRERALTRRLIDSRVDGLIIAPAGSDHRYIVAEQELGTAFVFVDRIPNPLVADAVVSDHRDGAAAAVHHLLQIGHRRVAFLSDDIEIATAKERHAGYLRALADAGIPADASIIKTGLRTEIDAGVATTEVLAMSMPPTAIFASRNVVTMGVVAALHHLRLHNQIALVGFDDIPLGQALDPGVTVVAQNIRELGRVAMDRLLARIAGDTSPIAVHTIKTTLIARGSGELPPTNANPSSARRASRRSADGPPAV